MLKKNDRVEFVVNGVTLYGVIISVSKKSGRAKAVIDGGIREVSSGHSFFKLSDKPLEKDPAGGPMEGWALKGYKEFPAMSEETIAYVSDITRNGKVVLYAKNTGHGEPDFFMPVGKGTHKDLQDFEEAVRKWRDMHSVGAKRKYSEPESSWVIWERGYRPYGVTSKVFWDRENGEMGLI